MDALQVGAAPNQLSWVPARLFQQHGQNASDTGLVEGTLLPLQPLLQDGEPLRLHRLRNLAGNRCRRRAVTRRIFERKGLGKTDLADEIQGCLEIPVALARKADDKI